MRLAITACLCALFVGQAAAHGAAVIDPAELAGRAAAAVDQHIVPAYVALASSTRRLHEETQDWCRDAVPTPPRAVLDAFRTAALDWARIEMIRFGPASQNNRLQRIAFWPDPRGVVRRQAGRALTSADETLATPGAIAAQSAAVQGLPALEIVLYADPAIVADKAAYRCRLASAIAGNVANLAQEIADGWRKADGWRQRMLAPGPENPAYRSDAEAVSELVRSLLTGLQIVRDQEILPRLKAVEASRTVAALPFVRSDLSKDYLLAGIGSLRALQEALRLDEVAARLGESEPDKNWMKAWIASAQDVLVRDAAAFEPLSTAAPEGRADIKALRQAAFFSNGLRQIIGRELAPAAGLLIGFNELDGD